MIKNKSLILTFNESENQTGLPNASSTKNNDSVVVALFGHLRASGRSGYCDIINGRWRYFYPFPGSFDPEDDTVGNERRAPVTQSFCPRTWDWGRILLFLLTLIWVGQRRFPRMVTFWAGVGPRGEWSTEWIDQLTDYSLITVSVLLVSSVRKGDYAFVIIFADSKALNLNEIFNVYYIKVVK